MLTSVTGGLGTVSTNVQGSVNPRDTSVRYQGINDIDLNDSWSKYQPSNEAEAKKYAAFRRAFQARKARQTKQLQQKQHEIQSVAKYWANAINNANTISTFCKVHALMDNMADTIRKAQEVTADQTPSKPPPSTIAKDSQDVGTEIEVSSAPTFGFDDVDLQEVNQPIPSDDDLMMFVEEEESSGSQHSTSKPKKYKEKEDDGHFKKRISKSTIQGR